MRISTHQFLLGSLDALLNQQSNANRLNQQIASGQTLLDAGDDPAAAGQVLAASSAISRLNYSSANAQAAQQSAQTGIGALQQVATVLNQLQAIAAQAANAATTQQQRDALAAQAQSAFDQLVQLGNSQDAGGNYIFAGSRTDGPAFQQNADGSVAFAGDGQTGRISLGPTLSVTSTVSGQNVFLGVPNGPGGVAVTAAATNTGPAYGVARSVSSISQVAAEARAGAEFAVSFAAAGDGSLTYTVTSGSGDPGGAAFAATSGVVASGSYTTGSDLQFGGLNFGVVGAPAAGDAFTVAPGQSTSVFDIAQRLIGSLRQAPNDPGTQQQVENVLANLSGAQTQVLSAQATLGATLTEVQSVQLQNTTQSTNAQVEVSNLQSANLPQVIANYSESLTALQAAQLAFARIQNLSLFNVIGS